MTPTAPAVEAKPEAPQKKPKLLVIDDEVSLGQSLSRMFGRRGYEVIVEAAPLEGTIAAQRHSPDVVLLDLRLPNVSGVDVLKDLKARTPDLQVVMMTGAADVPTALASIRSGAYDYLMKPFDDLNGVVNVVRKAYEHKQVLDRNRHLEQLVQGRPEVGFSRESPRTREISFDDLPQQVTQALGGVERDMLTLSNMPYAQAKRLALGAFNRSYLKGLLAKAQHNVTAAASLAGLDRSNFRRLLKQFAVAPKRDKGGLLGQR